MAAPLKLVVLGGTNAEASELAEASCSHFGGIESEKSAVAGSQIFHFSGSLTEESEGVLDFRVYVVPLDIDFRGLYQVLLSNADGVVAWVPSDFARLESIRRILGPLHQCLRERKDRGGTPPFVLQYHWGNGIVRARPEELDRALGVNAEAVTRVYSQGPGAEQAKGLEALLAKVTAKV